MTALWYLELDHILLETQREKHRLPSNEYELIPISALKVLGKVDEI